MKSTVPAYLVVGLALAMQACVLDRSDPRRLLENYASVELRCDLSECSARERNLLGALGRAADPIAEIFWKQVCPESARIRASLKDSQDPRDRETLEYLKINYGPFDRINGFRNFMKGQQGATAGAFYPSEMTAWEFEEFLVRNPSLKNSLESHTTLVRRSENGFQAVPYEKEFRTELSISAEHLRQAKNNVCRDFKPAP